MDELTLGLIGAGAVVVGGVVVYNAWQGAKVRRRMPRPMPEEAADAMNRPERDEELPFIEPVRQPVRREPAAPASAAAASAASEAARVEPTFGGVAPADEPADLQAESVGADVSAGSDGAAEQAADEGTPAAAAHEAPAAGVADDEHVEPVLPAATTISSAPPAIVDRRIDCIVPIRLGAPLPGDKILPVAQRLRRAGSKPVHIEGKPEGGQWELLQNGVRYEELRAAAQLANRSGALNELEFSEFVTGVQQFADAIDGAPEFPT